MWFLMLSVFNVINKYKVSKEYCFMFLRYQNKPTILNYSVQAAVGTKFYYFYVRKEIILS